MTDTELLAAIGRECKLRSQLGYTGGIYGHYDHETTKDLHDRLVELKVWRGVPVAYKQRWNGDTRYTEYMYGYYDADDSKTHMLMSVEEADETVERFVP